MVAYHVRLKDGPYGDLWQPDFNYRFSVKVLNPCTVQDEVYPALVETVEAAYPNADVQYHEPDEIPY